jgi:Amt family ammonium transporter
VKELPFILADQRKVRQVMYNLLSNAVKFTPDGGSVTVSAELSGGEQKCGRRKSRKASKKAVDRRHPDDHPAIIVCVHDSGIGILPENQQRVFDAFEQVDSSYTRQQQGTGLGLALTKRMVELHGGRVWLNSEVGKGSTFCFSLPLKTQDDNDNEDNNDSSTDEN